MTPEEENLRDWAVPHATDESSRRPPPKTPLAAMVWAVQEIDSLRSGRAIEPAWFRGGNAWWRSLETSSLLAAWVEARQRKISVADCDAIAIAAIKRFAQMVLAWAAQNQGGVHNRDDDGEHVYLSTSCLHGEHDYCQAPLVDADRRKVPATCKFCSTPCVCECHRKEP